jgi:hypothetical protein
MTRKNGTAHVQVLYRLNGKQIFTVTEKLWRCGDPKSPVSVQERLAAQGTFDRYGVELVAATRAGGRRRAVFDRLLDRFRTVEIIGPLGCGAASLDQNGAATSVHLPVRLRA